MQTCPYCLREITECVPYCYHCNKTTELVFLKLPNPSLPFFLAQLDGFQASQELNLFGFLKKNNMQVAPPSEEIESTEEVEVSKIGLGEINLPTKTPSALVLPTHEPADSTDLPSEWDETFLEESGKPEEGIKKGVATPLEMNPEENLEETRYLSINEILSYHKKGAEKDKVVAISAPKLSASASSLSASSIPDLLEPGLTEPDKSEVTPVAYSQPSKEPEILFNWSEPASEPMQMLLFTGEAPHNSAEEQAQAMLFPETATKKPFFSVVTITFILLIGILLGIFLGKFLR